ncbi:phosphorothioated DNA-binding restriction endonuclease [Xenorhabdus siamensis]|uniref:phosphorothioated DNA-binding restriction endonuclease n=1 Tax=Xenorhabdus siamensis TaxID=3136254 RepID=UPI0030F46520
MPTIKELQVAISNLSVWRKGDQRAPHKPLLLLYVLSQYQKGHERLFDYGEEIHQPLLNLLNHFGPRRKNHYPTLLFWRLRDPHFRQQILRVYNYECAICGYNLRHDDTPVGLEAAHIKWKQYGGPCTINNGLALCSLHHSAFDMGSISIDDNMQLLVSESINGGPMVKQLFWNFAKQPILLPQNRDYYLLESFINWHRN